VALRWEPMNGVRLVTDRRKLKIVLKNLVGNALKFTPAGEIVVAGRPDGPAYAFSVRDTGVGIAGEQLPHIFDMFRQGDCSDSRSYGGAGLGL
jgi:two-component system, sensor histidine kinase and response regulator